MLLCYIQARLLLDPELTPLQTWLVRSVEMSSGSNLFLVVIKLEHFVCSSQKISIVGRLRK